MRKLDKKEIFVMADNGNRGDLKKIQVQNKFDLASCEIIGNIFKGSNEISNNSVIINSLLSEIRCCEHVRIVKSTVVKSTLGTCTIVKNDSVVKDSCLTPLMVPVDGKDKLFFVLVNNSQVDGDVIFGGTDLRKTKSRGKSIYAFAHLGEGEFTKNVIFGTQPTKNNKKTLVQVGHFGYYGKMIIEAVAAYDKNGKISDIDSDKFFNCYLEAFSHVYFREKLNDATYEVARVNIGSGGSMSDYDPVKDTKSGAIILFSHTGTDVSYSPFLTVLYHSLLASSSSDITKHFKDGIVPPGTLVSTGKSNSFALEGYYIENEKKTFNDRSKYEMKFVIRYLKFLRMHTKLCKKGYAKTIGCQREGWRQAAKTLSSIASSVNRRWLKAYISTLETHSVPALKKRLGKKASDRIKKKLEAQEDLLSQKSHFLITGDKILADIDKIAAGMKETDIFRTSGQKVNVQAIGEQVHQLKVSFISLPKHVEV